VTDSNQKVTVAPGSTVFLPGVNGLIEVEGGKCPDSTAVSSEVQPWDNPNDVVALRFGGSIVGAMDGSDLSALGFRHSESPDDEERGAFGEAIQIDSVLPLHGAMAGQISPSSGTPVRILLSPDQTDLGTFKPIVSAVARRGGQVEFIVPRQKP